MKSIVSYLLIIHSLTLFSQQLQVDTIYLESGAIKTLTHLTNDSLLHQIRLSTGELIYNQVFPDQDSVLDKEGKTHVFYHDRLGFLQGEYRVYNERLILFRKDHYKDGLRNGYSYYYNSFSGKLESAFPYENGEIEGLVKSYYTNGIIAFRGFYKNGKPSGIRIFYDSTGATLNGSDTLSFNSTKWMVKCDNGLPNGIQKKYNESGELVQLGYYKHGEVHGLLFFYGENEELISKELYIHGEFKASLLQKDSHALAALDQMILLEPEVLLWRLERYQILHEKGDLNGAIRDLMFLVKQDSNDTEALYNLGIIYAQKGMIDKSFEYFMKCEALNYPNCKLPYNIGWIYFNKQDLENAETYFEVALKCDPKNQDAKFNLKLVKEEIESSRKN